MPSGIIEVANANNVQKNAEGEVHEDGAAEQEEDLVAEDDAVAGEVPGRLVLEVDVGRDDAVEVAPADDHAEHDGALEGALGVVDDPGERVGDGRVDAGGAEEGAGVLDLRVARDDEEDEADDADDDGGDVAVAAPAGAVRDDADGDGQGGGDGVGGHGEQLGLGAGVAHAAQDGGQEEREGVQGHEAAHVDGHVAVRLPVLEGGVDVALVKVLGGAALLAGDEAALDADAVVRGEEAGVLGPVEDHPPAEDADEDGGQALDDEDPSPAGLAADAVHGGDGGGEQAAEGAGEGGGGEEDGGTDADLGALVPAREVIVDAGEEAGLGDAEEPAGGEQAGEVGAEAHERHDGAPGDDDAGEEEARRQALEQGVGGGLEDGVADEEDGEREVVVAGACHAEVLLHAGETGVADVGAVEEREQVLINESRCQ
ncbi:hypothetical protein ColKHC_13076 [Colletotrichum higginsianum]|nr:hypothetical protein ColKHC_13076 [Colletotrichum higginsianum]